MNPVHDIIRDLELLQRSVDAILPRLDGLPHAGVPSDAVLEASGSLLLAIRDLRLAAVRASLRKDQSIDHAAKRSN